MIQTIRWFKDIEWTRNPPPAFRSEIERLISFLFYWPRSLCVVNVIVTYKSFALFVYSHSLELGIEKKTSASGQWTDGQANVIGYFVKFLKGRWSPGRFYYVLKLHGKKMSTWSIVIDKCDSKRPIFEYLTRSAEKRTVEWNRTTDPNAICLALRSSVTFQRHNKPTAFREYLFNYEWIPLNLAF